MTTDQLRNRSWWTGAQAWVLLDKNDLMATASDNSLAALQPSMAQAQDSGAFTGAACVDGAEYLIRGSLPEPAL